MAYLKVEFEEVSQLRDDFDLDLASAFAGEAVVIGHFLKGFRIFGKQAILQDSTLLVIELLFELRKASLEQTDELLPGQAFVLAFVLVGQLVKVKGRAGFPVDRRIERHFSTSA